MINDKYNLHLYYVRIPTVNLNNDNTLLHAFSGKELKRNACSETLRKYGQDDETNNIKTFSEQ